MKVLSAVGVREYRAVIPWVLRPGDHALEIGAHFGTTTAIMKTQVGDTGAVIG